MIQQHRVKQAEKLLQSYHGKEPLPVFLKQYFRQNPKMGSRDRREIGALCYQYFRLGKNNTRLPLIDALATGAFLSANTWNDFLETHWAERYPQAKALIDAETGEKIDWLLTVFPDLDPAAIFSFSDALSEGIDSLAFGISHLQQTGFWVRLRESKTVAALEVLEKAGIPVTRYENSQAFRLPTGTDVDVVFNKNFNHYGEVQDLSSQLCCALVPVKPREKVWDCCAASGGKSLMLLDKTPSIELCVSDVRPQTLENLAVRFSKSGSQAYKKAVIDLREPKNAISFHGNKGGRIEARHGFFDAIIADVPCTGSGTWGRNPENLAFFSEKLIGDYVEKQQQIIANVLPFLKKGGMLVYITCSAFKEENEQNVARFVTQHDLHLQQQLLVKGYEHRADTMFAAVMEKK